MQETVLKIRCQYPSHSVYPCMLYLLLVCGGAGPSAWTQIYHCTLYLLLVCGGAGGGQGPLHGPKHRVRAVLTPVFFKQKYKPS
jgi:hypothetical protein